MDEFQVKTHIFEGPLETLLELIEKRKLFINDISLSQVADDYISYVKSLENFPIADSANFILIASTLVLIKSKSLLPTLELTEEEEESIGDLEARLRELEKYRGLSRHLRERFDIHAEYARLPAKNMTIVFAPDKNITSTRILEIVRSVIANLPQVEKMAQAVVRQVISLEEMIENLTERITRGLKMSFKDFAGIRDRVESKEQKITAIVGFLAMLELVKQGIIKVRQDNDFNDIEMETDMVAVPKY